MKKIILISMSVSLFFLCGFSENNGKQISGDACSTANGYLGTDGKCYCDSGYSLIGRLIPKCLLTDNPFGGISQGGTSTVSSSTTTVDYSWIFSILYMIWVIIKRPLAVIGILGGVYGIIKFIKRARYN